jgi:hypothetical protein
LAHSTTTAAAVAPSDSCPLCGAPLADKQDWCLRCGDAARTRLGPSPSRKAPIVALAIVWTLSLGILAASLVKLASNSTPAPKTVTTVRTSPNAATPPTVATPTKHLDVARVALSIEGALLTQRHLHSKVSCPSVVPLEKGRTFTCTATTEGGHVTPFRVTEQNDAGSVTFGS